ncbi:MAG: ShlB/FhaC/HecB family hemolysin secretion/activation protein [Thalassospira sp.]|uniref:ShlB/FhaC/HecB family hemolysin secretion/activation protein n=1 Tax=Thalassospira sp. TaxID=1912094 RepID=UPI003A89BF71
MSSPIEGTFAHEKGMIGFQENNCFRGLISLACVLGMLGGIGAGIMPAHAQNQTQSALQNTALVDWPVQGLPGNIDDVTILQLPADPLNAANILLHKIENQGYPLAEVRIGADRLIVTFGEIVEVVVEGYTYGGVVRVEDERFDPGVEKLIHGYVDHLVGTSPTTDQLSHATALIDDIPGVTASILLERIDDLGHYRAVVRGAQERGGGVLSVRNTPTRRFESREAALHQEFYSTFVGGDILRVDLSAVNTTTTSRGYGLQVSHEFPVNAYGTFFESRISHYDTTGENQFEAEQSADSTSSTAAVVLGHAFSRHVEIADYIYGELDFRTEDNAGLGTSDYGVARAAFSETLHNDHGTTLSWSVSASGGQEFSDPDKRFGVIKGGGGLIFWLPELYETAEVRIEGAGQIGSRDVPGFELFSFGGNSNMRGFVPFEYAGVHGADLTIELAETFQPWAPSSPILTPYVFADAAYVANPSALASESRPESNEILSAGFGSKMTFFNGFSMDGWLAKPIHDGEDSDRSNNVVFYLQAQFSW